jgi:hypothetical protein
MNVNSTLYHVTLATSVVNVYVDQLQGRRIRERLSN